VIATTASSSAAPGRVELLCQRYPAVRVDGQPVALRLKRGLALLLMLSESNRRMARPLLAETLWPAVPPETGRARLRRLCHETNSVLGLDLLVGDADTLWLDSAAGPVHSDLARLRQQARQLLEEPAAAGAPAPSLVEALLAPDAHQLAEGFTLDAEPFMAWLDFHRAEYERLLLRALNTLAERLGSSGQAQLAVEAADRLIALDPLADAGHMALLTARARLGDAAGVEAAYFACATLLRDELGIRPSAQIEAAYAGAQARLLTDTAAGSAAPQRLPPIRFADTSDGAVAYLALGSDAAPTLIILFGLWSHIEVAWDEPRIRAILDRLARHWRVVLMDRRGTGLSERLALQQTVGAGVEDVDAVRRALGADQVWLLGNSAGGTIAIEYAAAFPQHLQGLLLYGAGARGAWAPDYPWAPTAEQLAQWLQELRSAWGQATSWGQFAPSMAEDEAARDWWARMLRQSMSRNSMPAVLSAFARMDVRDRLAQISVPTLIVQRRGDRIVREGAARYLAARIAGSRLVLHEGEDHPIWYGNTAAVLDEIERFVGEVQVRQS
jgi:pimeloyl-ACP methyl ester carboxylesterase/DNA-binding SARP family transcriptional activator